MFCSSELGKKAVVAWGPKLVFPMNAVYLVPGYIHSISFTKQQKQNLTSACSLFVYTTEFVVIYTAPSCAHLLKQKEKVKEGEGERETARKEEEY